MMTTADIAIVGAGPAGAVLGLSLARRGWDVIMLERESFPRHKVCGEFISPEALPVLDGLGAAGRLASLGPARVEQARLYAAGSRPVDLPLPGPGLGLSRFALDQALAEAAVAAGARLLTGADVRGVQPDRDGWRIGVRREQGGQVRVEYRAREVVGAWGRQAPRARAGSSPDRAELGRDRPAQPPGLVGLKAHLAGAHVPNSVELYLFAGGYLGLCPVEAGRVNACALLTPRALRQAGGSLTGLLAYLAPEHPDLRDRLKGAAVLPETRKAVAGVRLTARPAPVRGGFAHLGDAAGMVAPLCGDGLAIALTSAALCAPLADRCLQGEISRGEWLRRYDGVCRKGFGTPLLVGRILHELLVRPGAARLLGAAARLAPALGGALLGATRSHRGEAMV